MKILCIGDFHGKFPVRLQKLVKREKTDLVISAGDYFPWSMKKEFFKHVYKSKSKNLWDIFGKKKYKQLTLKDLRDGERNVIKKLDNFSVPAVVVPGNWDSTGINDQYSEKQWGKRTSWKWDVQDFFSKIIKKYKNINSIPYSYAKVGDLVFIGGYGHSSPGSVKSKAYKRHRDKLEKLFKKFSKENREGRVIFLFHNMPYNCKLDQIRSEDADESVIGKHFGSKLIRRIINKYHPVLAIGGHMHENQGKCNIGKTLVLNAGAALEGKCAVIDFDEERGAVNGIPSSRAKIKSVRFVN